MKDTKAKQRQGRGVNGPKERVSVALETSFKAMIFSRNVPICGDSTPLNEPSRLDAVEFFNGSG
jgi:hypothetical protein